MTRTFVPIYIVIHVAPSDAPTTLNAQGDVVGIMNSSKTLVATYTYDGCDICHGHRATIG